MRDVRLLVFGLGYVGSAVARTAAAANFAVAGTTRSPGTGIGFDDAAAEMAQATHLLSTVPPDESGDPVLARHGDAIAAAPDLRWIGYLSTTGVYGDRGGGWVDEDTDARADIGPQPTAAGGGGRLAAIRRSLRGRYVPARRHLRAWAIGVRRSARGQRRGASSSRATRSDASIATTSSAPCWRRCGRSARAGARVLNLADDEPAESADVVAEAARLLGVARTRGSAIRARTRRDEPDGAQLLGGEPQGRPSRRTQQALGLRWLYPSYREGLRAILAEESGQASGVAAPGPAAATGDDRRPSPGSPERPGR